MGSDLTYEDMTNRKLEDYSYNVIGSEIISNKNCYLLEQIPKISKTNYSKHISWITKDDFLPIKENSFDKNRTLIKEKIFTYQKIENYHILNSILVKNYINNHTTHLKFYNIIVNSNIKDDFFHEKNLKRLPK